MSQKYKKFQYAGTSYQKNKGSTATIPDSFDINKTKLPLDTRSIGIRADEIDNFYLKLNKAARFEGDKFEFFKRGKKGILYQIKPYFGDFNFSSFCNRQYENIKKLNLKVTNPPIKLKSTWRLIVGLGIESVYETSITLHYIYGFPYMLGSAVKGIVRNWAINKFFNKEGDRTSGALSDEGFCRIFGSPEDSILREHVGSVIFYDAYPCELPKIDPDIMNPHYGPYYSDEKNEIPPADYHNPNPVFFLTIINTSFEFNIGIKEKDNNKINKGELTGERPFELAKKWLKCALTEHGIGAKTAVGYGYMQ